MRTLYLLLALLTACALAVITKRDDGTVLVHRIKSRALPIVTAIEEHEGESVAGPRKDADDANHLLDNIEKESKEEQKAEEQQHKEEDEAYDEKAQEDLEKTGKDVAADDVHAKLDEEEVHEKLDKVLGKDEIEKRKRDAEAEEVHKELDKEFGEDTSAKKSRKGGDGDDDESLPEGSGPHTTEEGSGAAATESAAPKPAEEGAPTSNTTSAAQDARDVDRELDIIDVGPNPQSYSAQCRICIMVLTRGVKRKDNLVDIANPCSANGERWKPACMKYYEENQQALFRALEPAAVCNAVKMCGSEETERWEADVVEVGKANEGGKEGSSRLAHGLVTILAKERSSAQELDSGTGERFYREQVAFEGRPFPFVPFVSAALTNFEIDGHEDLRVQIIVEKITVNGFVVVVRTWGTSKIEMLGVDWFAYDKSFGFRREIWSGTVDMSRRLVEGEKMEMKVFFPAPMAVAPIVTLGLEGVDAEHVNSPSLQLNATAVTRFGFTASIASRDNSKINSAMVSWIALDRKAAPPANDIQTGTIENVWNSTENFRNFWQPPLGDRSWVGSIKFKTPYDSPPFIDLRILDFSLAPEVTQRLRMYAENVDGNGFDLKIKTWKESRIRSLGVQWVAIPAPPRFVPGKVAEENVVDTANDQVQDSSHAGEDSSSESSTSTTEETTSTSTSTTEEETTTHE